MQPIISELNFSSRLRYAVASDVGCIRTENQDSFGIINHKQIHVFVVADGMGGVQGGKVASEMAVELLASKIKAVLSLSEDILRTLILDIHKQIYNRSLSDSNLSGMGTTLVGLAFDGAKVYFFNVGDSRLYLVRDSQIRQLTSDHTVVNELLSSGAITQDQARNHPVSHMLTRSLGASAELVVDCFEMTEKPGLGDQFILCSDGLHGMLDKQVLLDLCIKNPEKLAVAKMIALANERGGKDNITALIVTIGEVNSSDQNKVNLDSVAPSQNTSATYLYIAVSLVLLAATVFFAKFYDNNKRIDNLPLLNKSTDKVGVADLLVDKEKQREAIHSGTENLAKFIKNQNLEISELERKIKYFLMSDEQLLAENSKLSTNHLVFQAKFNQIEPQIVKSRKTENKLSASLARLAEVDHLSVAKSLLIEIPELQILIDSFTQATQKYLDLIEQRAFKDSDPNFQNQFDAALRQRSEKSAELKEVLELKIRTVLEQEKQKQEHLIADLSRNEELAKEFELELADLDYVIKEKQDMNNPEQIQIKIDQLKQKVLEIKAKLDA